MLPLKTLAAVPVGRWTRLAGYRVTGRYSAQDI